MRLSGVSLLGRSAVSAIVLLAVASCSSSSASAPGSPQAVASTSPPSTSPPTAAASATTSTVPSSAPSAAVATATASPKPGTFTISLPVTDLTGTLDTPYKGLRSVQARRAPAGVRSSSTGSEAPAERWWFSIFQGPLPAGVDPLCPGTSLKTATGFEDVTNSPLGKGGCKGDDKHLATAPAGGQICNGGFLIYTTTIPNDAVGTLYASLEKAQPDGTISGLTSTTETGPKLDVYPNQIDLSKYSCQPAG